MSGNIDKATLQHGGNLSWLAAHYPDAARPFIDLSTGINPYPYPLLVIDPKWHHRLPDNVEMQVAQSAAANYYRVNPQHLALASGMQPLMVALASLRLKEFGVSSVSILSPTYSEHERMWTAMGHNVKAVATLNDMQGDVAIICNPNNPDGRIIPLAELIALAETLAKHNGWLIMDESFADLMAEQNRISAPNVITLRSCGKFFGVAGLRVSAVIAPDPWIEWLRIALGPWPISSSACHLLPEMMNNTAWSIAMRSQLEREASNWRAMLARYFPIVGYTSLFTLAQNANAPYWHDYLASEGILIRSFDAHPGWLRFGLPHHTHLQRLDHTLSSAHPPA